MANVRDRAGAYDVAVPQALEPRVTFVELHDTAAVHAPDAEAGGSSVDRSTDVVPRVMRSGGQRRTGMKHFFHWMVPVFLLGSPACGTSTSDEHGHRAHALSESVPKTATKPHGSHDAAFGGLVLMDGHDHHAELVLDVKTGTHRVYVSDGARSPLPASAFDEVTLKVTPEGEAEETLPLTRAADNRYWFATGKPVPATGTMIRLSYAKNGAVLYDVELPVEYVLTGKMPDAPAGATHHHGSDGHHHAH